MAKRKRAKRELRCPHCGTVVVTANAVGHIIVNNHSILPTDDGRLEWIDWGFSTRKVVHLCDKGTAWELPVPEPLGHSIPLRFDLHHVGTP